MAVAALHCGPTPEKLVREVEKQLQARAIDGLARHIDGTYGDPLGGRDTLLRDLEELDRAYPRWRIEWTEDALESNTTALVASIQTRLEAELVGRPVWKAEGPMRIALHRSDRWRIQGGLLTDLRDVRRLMAARRAALEANDVDGLAEVLHPHYRDGDIDKEEAVGKLRRDLTGVAVRFEPTHYRLEVRRDLAHLDEHYVITVNGRRNPPSVAGLTLRKTAGRWKIAAGLYRSE